MAIPCYGARDEVLDRLKAHQRQVTGPHEDPESAVDHVDHGPVPRELVEMEVKMPHFADIFHRHLQSQNVILERTVPTCPKPQRGPLQHLNKLEQGQPIWALLLRRDLATLVTLFQVLQEKGSPDGFAYRCLVARTIPRAKHRLLCEPVACPP